MFALPSIVKEDSKNNDIVIHNQLKHKLYDYFVTKVQKSTIDILGRMDNDERYLYFLQYGILRRFEGEGEILYIELPQIPKNIVVYRRPIARRKSFDKLYLNKKDLPHIPLLEGEDQLKLLSLESNFILKIDHLISLNNLLFLNLYDNKIQEIENLINVPKLRALLLGKNLIEKIKGLSCLTMLEVLDLHSNKIKQIENLNTLTKLRIVNLANNQLTSFIELLVNKELEEINLRKNLIVSIPNLENNWVKMKKINLAKNMITKIEFLDTFRKLNSLQELYIEDNPVLSISDSFQKLLSLPLRFRDQNNYQKFQSLKNQLTNNKQKEDFKTILSSKNSNDDLPEEEREKRINKIRAEWEKEYQFIVSNGFNGYNTKKIKETKMQLCHVEIEGEHTLNLYGNAIEVLTYEELYNDITTMQIEFFNYDILFQSKNIGKILKFKNLSRLIFINTNLHSFYQLLKLEEIPKLESITIKENEICNSGLLYYFLIYRLQNIKYFNDVEITNKDILISKQLFEPFDSGISFRENKKDNDYKKENANKLKSNTKDEIQKINFLNYVKNNLLIALDEIIDV